MFRVLYSGKTLKLQKMKRANLELLFSVSRRRSIRVLILLGIFYILFVCCEFPFLFKNGEKMFTSNDGFFNSKPFLLESEENLEEKEAPLRPVDFAYQSVADGRIREFARHPLSGLNFTAGIANSSSKGSILKSANDALELGQKLWRELELIGKNSSNRGFSSFAGLNKSSSGGSSSELCPHSISVSGDEFSKNRRLMILPCGLTLGSHITVVGKPRAAHAETEPKISLLKEGQYLMVSQFMMELQGLKTVEGEDPPRILHFNPRLKGDWSGKPVIEHNTCYRMQWGTSQRCEGWKSRADEETGELKAFPFSIFF